MTTLAASGPVPPFFILLTLVLGAVVVISLILAKFKQSLLVGYFMSGLLIANSGVLSWLGVEDNTKYIGVLSELGVVLLLFTLGIEFSMKELKALKKPIFLGGMLQIGLTIGVTMLVTSFFGVSLSHGFIIGSIVALSSTAVSIKSFQDMQLAGTPQARTTLAIAIAQDLVAILLMVLIPVLAGGEGGGTLNFLIAGGKGLVFTVAVVILSRHGFPQMLDAVARTNSRELFTISVLALCAAVAVLSSFLGLSPALGAFAAGLVVSESIYSHRVLSDILPFKDLFLTVFFVSVGLLIDIEVLQQHWVSIAGLTIVVFVVKGVIVSFSAKMSGLTFGTSLVTAASLASTGEFSIVLLNHSSSYQIVSDEWSQILLASSAIGMAGVPTLMRLALNLTIKIKPDSRVARRVLGKDLQEDVEAMSDHVVICGSGPVGTNLQKKLCKANVEFIVVEMNASTVKRLLCEGKNALWGDITEEAMLKKAHVQTARSIVITFPELRVALKTIEQARHLNPQVRMYARAKFSKEATLLRAAGFDQVLHDEELSGRAMIHTIMQSYDEEFDEDWVS